MAHGYPHGKRHVRFFKKPGKLGLQAEVNPALPHVSVPHDGAIVECSAELAWRLVERGRAEMVNVAAPAPAPAEEPATPVIDSDDKGRLSTRFRGATRKKSTRAKTGPLN